MTKNKTSNSITKNFIYNMVYQVLIVLFPLVTSPYISRVLGTEGLGTYSYRYSIANYFVIFAMLGISMHGNRTIAVVRADKKALSSEFCNIFTAHMLISLTAFTVYMVYVINFVSKSKIIALIEGIYVLSALFDINWFFFGIERFDLTVTRNIIVKILSVVSIFVFVKTQEDLWKYAFIMSAGIFVSQSFVWLYLHQNIEFIKPSWDKIVKHLKPMLILFVPVVAISLYKLMDKIMLGYMTTMSEVGIYENAEKINSIPSSVITALGTVMLPRMSNFSAQGDKKNSAVYINISMQVVTLMASAISFGIISVGVVFAPVFFGAEFARSGEVVTLLAPTILFIAWADVLRMQFLIPNHKDKVYICSMIGGALVNFIINVLLIPHMGALGAAIGTIGAEGTVLILQAIGSKRALPLFKYIKEAFPYLICGGIMCLIVSALRVHLPTSIICLLVEVLLGGIVYVILVLGYWVLSKCELGMLALKMVKSKFLKN